MPVLRGAVCPPKRSTTGRLGTRLLRALTAPPPRTTAPTAPVTADLVEGTGTRSFGAVTTSAGDWLVVEVEVQDDNTGTWPVTASGLTFTQQVDTGTGTGIRGRILDSTAPDAAGGSRTVTVTPSVGTRSYRARLTVVRGSDGPGNVAGIKTAQTVSFARQDAHSMLFMAVMDWSTGAVGSPTWTPGGSTVASQQGTNATYVFGRWDDSGAAGTATTGDNGTAYTTPAVVVLEMLGTTVAGAGPPVRPWHSPVRARPAPFRTGCVLARAGILTVGVPATGPPLYPAGRPIQARQQPARGGRTSNRVGTFAGAGPVLRPPDGSAPARQPPARGGSTQDRAGLFAGVGPTLKAQAGAIFARLRTLPLRGRTTAHVGVFAGSGPPVRPADGPVRAQALPVRGGRTAGRVGPLTVVTPTTGPPVYPLSRPIQPKRLPQQGGRTEHVAGIYVGTGPALRAVRAPVQARTLPARGGRVVARVGIFTSTVPQAGPPLYPLGHPVCARRLPVRSGTVGRRSGPYAGTGPPPPQLRQPVGQSRRQPPPPARGRVGSLRGPLGVLGPPTRPLQRPIRARLPAPVRTGRAGTTLLPPVVIPPPPFSVGVLTAGMSGTASIGGGTGTTAALAATTGPTGSVAAGTSQTGGVTATTSPTGGP